MDFLGIFSSALLLFLLLLIVLNIYCIHAYYKLCDKVNDMYFIMNSIKKDIQQEKFQEQIKCIFETNKGKNENKEINILPNNFIYYPTSPSSLIEVSDDDGTTYSYESDVDESYNSDNQQIKNVHMELDLDNLDNIHVMLLDEIANIEELNIENSFDNVKNKNIETQQNNLLPVVQEDLSSSALQEDLSSSVLQEDLSSSVLKEDLSSSALQEDLSSSVLKEDLSSSVLQEDLLSPVVKEDLLSPVVQIETLPLEKVVQRKRESRKNVGENKEDYKKMNLTDLRKYVIDNQMNIDVSKMKKPEILKAIELKSMEELKTTEEVLLANEHKLEEEHKTMDELCQ